MRTLRAFLILLSSAMAIVACRDGQFDKRPLGTEQVALTITPLESQRLGSCATKAHCHQLQVNFEVRARDGRSLSSETLSLTATHKDRVVSGVSTANADANGMLSFAIEFVEYPHEHGLKFQTLFTIASPQWGNQSFCALVEPSLPSGPVHSFKSCEAKGFQAVVLGEPPTYAVETKDVVILDVPPAKGPVREAQLRATFSIRDLKRLSVASEMPVKWRLQFGETTLEGVATTTVAGDFDIDFAMPFSPFKNEQNYLILFTIESVDSPEKRMSGYLVLNFERSNARPLVASGMGLPPAVFTGQNANTSLPLIQTLSMNPVIVRAVEGESTYELSEDLRLLAVRTYSFQAKLFLNRSRLTGAPESVNLAGNKIIGKLFFVAAETNDVIAEIPFNQTIDSESRLSLKLQAKMRDFSDSRDRFRMLIAVSLPEFLDVPSAYFEYGLDGSVEVRSRDEAERVLRDRLLDWTQVRPEPKPVRSDKTELLRNFIDIRSAPDSQLPEMNREALKTLLTQSWDSPAPAVWTEIYNSLRPDLSRDERKLINDRMIFEKMRVRELVFVNEVESVEFLGRKIVDAKLRTTALTFRVRGRGERCLAISLASLTNTPPTRNYSFCFEDPALFDMEDKWYVFELQNADATTVRYLLKDPLPAQLTQEKLAAADLFKHPELHRAYLLSRMLWPPNL